MRDVPHILALEKSVAFTKRLKEELEHIHQPCHLKAVKSPQDFLQEIKVEMPDAVIIGNAPENFDPVSLLTSVKTVNASLLVIVILAKSDLESGIRCIKSGAADVILKSKPEQVALALKGVFNAVSMPCISESLPPDAAGPEVQQPSPQPGSGYIVTELKRLNAELVRRIENQTEELNDTSRKHQLVEQEFQHKDKFFYKLTEHSGDLTVILDKDGVIKYQNPAIVRILGFNPAERVGESGFSHIHPDDLSYVKFMFMKYREKPGLAPKIEFRVRHKDGSWVYLEAIGNNLLDDDTINGIIIVIRNINDRKLAETRLLESRELLNSVLSTAAIAICLSDENGYFVDTNPFCCRLFGYNHDELVGKHFTTLLLPEQHEIANIAYQTFISEVIYKSTDQWKGLRKDGKVMELYTTAGIFKNAEKKRFIVLTFTDITERKKGHALLKEVHEKLERQHAERALELREANRLLKQKNAELIKIESELRESAEKFRLTFDQSSIGAAITSLDLRFISINRAYSKIVGYSQAELQTMHLSDVIHPDDFEKYLQVLKRAAKGPKRYTRRTLHKDGHIIWTQVTTGLVKDQNGNPLYYLSQIEDISEQKQIEAALVQSTDLLETIIDKIPGSVYHGVFEPDGKFSMHFISDGIYDLTGLEPDAVMNNPDSIFEVIHPDDRKAFTRKLEEALRTLAPISIEYRVISLTGEVKWVRDSARYQRNENGDVIVDGVAFDITESKLAEDALKNSENDYRSIFENAHDPIIIFEPDDEQILAVNRRACELYCYSEDEFMNLSMIDVSKYPARGRLHLNDLMKRGRYDGFETVHIRKDGEELVLEISATVVSYKGKRAVLSINHDLTEKKQAENALRQSERRYRRIVDTALEGIWLLRPDSTTEYVNQQMADLLGYTAEEIHDHDIFTYVARDEHSKLTHHLISTKKGFKKHHDIRFIRKDGTSLWAIVSETPRFDPHGDYIGTLVMVTDITDRKNTEDALRESERRYRTLAENFPNGVAMTIDRNYRCILAEGDVFRQTRKGSRTKTEGRLVDYIEPPEVAALFRSRYESAFRGEKQFFEMNYVGRDWEIYVVPNAGEDGKIDTLTVIGHDITFRKKIENALRNLVELESLITRISSRLINLPTSEIDAVLNEGLEQIADFIGTELSIIYQFSDDYKNATCSHQYHKLNKQSEPIRITSTISTEPFRPILEKLLQFEAVSFTNLDSFPAESISTKDAILALNVNSFVALPIRIENRVFAALAFMHRAPLDVLSKESVQLLEIFRDVVASALERKKKEEELEKSRHLYQAIIDTQTELVSRSLPDGTLTFANQAYCRYFGKSQEELIGGSLTPYVPEADKHVLGCGLSNLSPEQPQLTCEHHVLAGDGSVRWLQWANTAIFNEAGEIIEVQSVGRDITERKLAEEALRETTLKLETTAKAGRVGLWDFDLKTNKVFHSAECKTQLGYGDDEIGDNPEEWESLVHPDDIKHAWNIVNDAMVSGQSNHEVLVRMLHRDGSYRRILIQGSFVRDESGSPIKIQGSQIDITERKRAEEALQESEEKLRLFIEHAPASLAMFDRNMRYLSTSRRWRSDYGLSDRDIIGRSHYEIFPDIPEHWKAAHWRGLSGEVITNDEDRFERADGSVLWERWEVRPWHTASGETGGIVIFTEDITGRKQAQEALKESEERFRLVFYTSPDAITINRMEDGLCIDINDSFTQITGYTREDAIGKTVHDVDIWYNPEDRKEAVRRLKETGRCRNLEAKFRRKDGSIMTGYFSASTILLNGTPHIITTTRDITEQRLAQDALRESEERHRIISELLSDYIYFGIEETNKASKLIWVTGAFEKITGYTLEEVNALPGGWMSVVHPEEHRKLSGALSGKPQEEVHEYRILTKSGQVRWLRDQFKPVFDENETGVVYIYGAVKDITEQKLAEVALIKSEARHRKSVESTPHPVFTIDTEGFIRSWNPASARAFGYSESGITGQKWEMLFPNPDDRKKIVLMIMEAVHGRPCKSTPVTYRCKDGHDRPMNLYIYAFPEGEEMVEMLVFASGDIKGLAQAE